MNENKTPELRLFGMPRMYTWCFLIGAALGALAMNSWWVFTQPDMPLFLTRPGAIDIPKPDKILRSGDETLLWGGPDQSDHFIVSESRLNHDRLRYGLGREHFHALIEPEYEPASEAEDWLPDGHRVLMVHIEDEVRVYPIGLLTTHEVVNDTVGGRPIFAAFCVLADLGAVYDRRVNGRPHTFALSGYTYSEPDVWDGMNAFVLWDRETESLWWPPIGRAVSGLMIDAPLTVLERELWAQTTWGEVKSLHPDALVLKRGQTLNPPENWPRYETRGQDGQFDSGSAIPPRWGGNAGSGSSKPQPAGSGSFTKTN